LNNNKKKRHGKHKQIQLSPDSFFSSSFFSSSVFLLGLCFFLGGLLLVVRSNITGPLLEEVVVGA
jgi:hypothetical protein